MYYRRFHCFTQKGADLASCSSTIKWRRRRRLSGQKQLFSDHLDLSGLVAMMAQVTQ
jgi:hypothetical protein